MADSFASRHAAIIISVPVAGIATTFCVINLGSCWAMAYFPLLWGGTSLALEFLLRGNEMAGAGLWFKLAFWTFFPAGLLVLTIITAANALGAS